MARWLAGTRSAKAAQSMALRAALRPAMLRLRDKGGETAAGGGPGQGPEPGGGDLGPGGG